MLSKSRCQPGVFRRYGLQRPRRDFAFWSARLWQDHARQSYCQQPVQTGGTKHFRNAERLEALHLPALRSRKRERRCPVSRVGAGSWPGFQPGLDSPEYLRLELEQFLRDRSVPPEHAMQELQDVEYALKQGGQQHFLSIKGPELLSKYVGEAETTIRNIFAEARQRATFYTPVVLFFDELEFMFSRRGSGSPATSRRRSSPSSSPRSTASRKPATSSSSAPATAST